MESRGNRPHRPLGRRGDRRLLRMHRVAWIHRRALPSSRAGQGRRRNHRDGRARGSRGRIHRRLRDAEYRSRHRQSGGRWIHHPAGEARSGVAGSRDRRDLRRTARRDARRIRRDGRRRCRSGERRWQARRKCAADADSARVRANFRHSGDRPLRGADACLTVAR